MNSEEAQTDMREMVYVTYAYVGAMWRHCPAFGFGVLHAFFTFLWLLCSRLSNMAADCNCWIIIRLYSVKPMYNDC